MINHHKQLKKSGGKSAGFILNIVMIAVVLAVAFFSQSGSFKPFSETAPEQATEQSGNYWTMAKNWFSTNIYPRFSAEVEKRGEIAKEEIEQQKMSAAQSLWGSIKKYLSEKISKLFGADVE